MTQTAMRAAHAVKRSNLRGSLPVDEPLLLDGDYEQTASQTSDVVSPFEPVSSQTEQPGTPNGMAAGTVATPRFARSGTTLWRIARAKTMRAVNNSRRMNSTQTIRGLTVTLHTANAVAVTGSSKDLAVYCNSISGSYLSALLLCIPLGLAGYLLHWPAEVQFTLNFLALIPLALLLGEITEDLALRFGDIVGGLLNASLGNVVELILSIAALQKGLYNVVAMSLIGSILSNQLLVLGCCFFFGGLRFREQSYNPLANKTSTSLLFMACVGVVIPTASRQLYSTETLPESDTLMLSRLVAVVLALLYCSYLFFQLKTHAYAFSGEDDENEPNLSIAGAMVGLAVVTVIIAWCSERVTGCIEEVASSTGLSSDFLGLIVLPIAGNACEHLTAVYVAVKDKMDLAIGISLGSSIQIALFVVPFVVLLGWVIDRPMSLNFDSFATLILTFSVMHMQMVCSDARSNWLLGLQLIATYCLIAFVFYYVHTQRGDGAPAPVAAPVDTLLGKLPSDLVSDLQALLQSYQLHMQ